MEPYASSGMKKNRKCIVSGGRWIREPGFTTQRAIMEGVYRPGSGAEAQGNQPRKLGVAAPDDDEDILRALSESMDLGSVRNPILATDAG